MGHWKQDSKGQTIRKLGVYVPISSRRNEAGHYACKTCGGHFPEGDFWRTNRGPYPVCKRCDAPARQAARYGLTVEEVAARLDEQGRRCAICGISANVAERAFAVDHNHACCPGRTTCGQCVRGLLCHSCNLALGGFKDDVGLLRKAVAYLESHGVR